MMMQQDKELVALEAQTNNDENEVNQENEITSLSEYLERDLDADFIFEYSDFITSLER